MSRRGLTAREVDVAATMLRTLEPPPGVRVLILSGNKVGNAGVMALADAAAHGAFARVERLYLDSVQLGDAGLAELAGALDAGALPQLTFLDLTRNQFGDVGMMALAGAVERGALAQLTTLYLYNNKIGGVGFAALVKAFSSTCSPAKLTQLYADNNQIDEVGVTALSETVEQGRLPLLRAIHLSGNPVPPGAVDAVVQSVEARAGLESTSSSTRPTPQTCDVELAPVE